MKKRLLWKMFTLIAIGTIVLFWSIDLLNRQAENQMSFIDLEHQRELVAFGREAERLFLAGDTALLSKWLKELQEREQTWAAVVQSSVKTFADSQLSEQFLRGHRLGRNVEWKIHLYFKENPIMDVTFSDGKTRFLILLPQRMRPGGYYPIAQILLQIALPFILLSMLCWLLYQHVMRPIKALAKATRRFSDGDYDVQIKTELGKRDDELGELVSCFDQMAKRTGNLITTQNQLLENLSHELRTPLARLDMAVECIKQGVQSGDSVERLSGESAVMRELVEDTLMLVWLNNEMPELNKEQFDLADLLEVICADARFEYPHHQVLLECPASLPIANSSQRAIGQALENIIRNALQHTPQNQSVTVQAKTQQGQLCIQISDQGSGIPEYLLEDVFQPFFQVDKSRRKQRSVIPLAEGVRRGGFGLGLALALRQIKAVGGELIAVNRYGHIANEILGLQMTVKLPLSV